MDPAKSRLQRDETQPGEMSGASTPGGGSGEGASGRPTAARSSQGNPAPHYVDPIVGNFGSARQLKPKGKNLTEGGFDSEETENASFTSDIGSENDPGRESEIKFETPGQAGAPIAKGAAPGGGESGRKTGQPYGPLGSNEDA